MLGLVVQKLVPGDRILVGWMIRRLLVLGSMWKDASGFFGRNWVAQA